MIVVGGGGEVVVVVMVVWGQCVLPKTLSVGVPTKFGQNIRKGSNKVI